MEKPRLGSSRLSAVLYCRKGESYEEIGAVRRAFGDVDVLDFSRADNRSLLVDFRSM